MPPLRYVYYAMPRHAALRRLSRVMQYMRYAAAMLLLHDDDYAADVAAAMLRRAAFRQICGAVFLLRAAATPWRFSCYAEMPRSLLLMIFAAAAFSPLPLMRAYDAMMLPLSAAMRSRLLRYAALMPPLPLPSAADGMLLRCRQRFRACFVLCAAYANTVSLLCFTRAYAAAAARR